MGSQMVVSLQRWVKLLEQFKHSTRNLRGHRCAPVDDFLDALQQPGRRSILQQIATSPRTDGIKNPLVISVNRQRQKENLGIPFLQQTNPFNARNPRQANVYPDHIRRPRTQTVEGFLHRAEAARTAESFRTTNQQSESFGIWRWSSTMATSMTGGVTNVVRSISHCGLGTSSISLHLTSNWLLTTLLV